MTRLEVLTLSYDPLTQAVDDQPLLALQERAEVIQHQSYLVGPPHALVLLLTTRPRAQQPPQRARHVVSYVSQETSAPAQHAQPKKSTRQKRAETLEAAKAALSEQELSAFEGLRVWRNEEAARVGVPPFEVCSNQALIELVTRKPHTLTALRAIEGLGEKRVRRFGEALLKQLEAHQLTHVDSTPQEERS